MDHRIFRMAASLTGGRSRGECRVGGRTSSVRLGFGSAARLGLAPLGRRAARFHRGLDTLERQEAGLVVILPGIEGCSSVNDSIARGLIEAGCPAAIRIEEIINEDEPLQEKEQGRYRVGKAHDSLVVSVQRQYYKWNSKNETGDVFTWLNER